MAYWLVKSEPSTYSFADLTRDGRTVWDGVRNHTAAIHLKAMREGEEVLFYHSQVGLEIVGLAKVVHEAYLDPSDPTGRFVAVELSPLHRLPKPVTLADMKATQSLAEMAMLRLSRLSVSPVSPEEWSVILAMGGMAREGRATPQSEDIAVPINGAGSKGEG